MNLIKELKQEHREIISLLNNLTSYMAGEIMARIEILLNLRNLKYVLTKHVEKENKYLYPQLVKAKDKKARETAKKYSKEMLEIGKQVFAFFGQYLHLQISELETNERFKEELKDIAVIVSRRIAAEERVLFPLFEKCCR